MYYGQGSNLSIEQQKMAGQVQVIRPSEVIGGAHDKHQALSTPPEITPEQDNSLAAAAKTIGILEPSLNKINS